MAKNNKTAVEWLIDQLKGRYDIDIEKLTVCAAAKEIEREQIIEAFDCDGSPQPGEEWISNGEKYYNETYGERKGARAGG